MFVFVPLVAAFLASSAAVDNMAKLEPEVTKTLMALFGPKYKSILFKRAELVDSDLSRAPDERAKLNSLKKYCEKWGYREVFICANVKSILERYIA